MHGRALPPPLLFIALPLRPFIGSQPLTFGDLPLEGRVARCSARCTERCSRRRGPPRLSTITTSCEPGTSPHSSTSGSDRQHFCSPGGAVRRYPFRLCVPTASETRHGPRERGASRRWRMCNKCACVRGASEARQRPDKRALTRGPIRARRQRRLRQRVVRGASEGEPNPSSEGLHTRKACPRALSCSAPRAASTPGR